MWFPKNRRSMFQRVVAAVCQSWERVRRERRLAQVRSRRQRRSWDCRGALVQVLEPRTMLTIDLGDAPSPYPTTLAENGAQHTDTGLMLGATRDSEVDGTHSANADADGADEDGVTFGTIQVGALGATATVNVAGITTTGKLDAWIDFNGDGNWGGPGEQIASSVAVVNGDNTITFDVPSWAKDGTTFARFRLSTAGNLGPEGLAADGEVEDYAVSIIPPAATSGLFGAQNTVSIGADGVFSVFAADMDGDGDMDMLSANFSENYIAWYENNGNQKFLGPQRFTEHALGVGIPGPASVTAADVDGDGDMDAVSASRSDFDDRITWFENDGSQNFTRHTIDGSNNSPTNVTTADVDGDGDTDILSASLDNKITWYENNGSQIFTIHTISTAVNGPQSVTAADVDGDGDLDVLSASANDDKIAWYENDGSQTFTAHTISTAADGAYSVMAADVDGDGDLDVLSASLIGGIAWYENDGSQIFTAHTISTAAVGARSVTAADVDGDGDIDVLSASSDDDKIAWYKNDGSQNFTAHNVNSPDPDAPGSGANGNADFARAVIAADVDGDGDLDVISASQLDTKVAWYQNVTASVISDFDTPVTYVENAAPLILDANATVADLDTTRFAGSVLTISLTANAEATDRLEFRQVTRLLRVSGSNLIFRGTIVGSFTGGVGTDPLVITLNFSATVSAVQTVLRNVTYRSVSANPSTLPRTVQVTLSEAGVNSNQPTKTINVTAVPIPPFDSAPPAPPATSNKASSATANSLSDTNSNAGHTSSSTLVSAAASTDNDQYGDDVPSFLYDGDALSGRKKRRRSQ